MPPGLSAEEIALAVKDHVRAFTGTDDFEDDMTLVVLRVPEVIGSALLPSSPAMEPALAPGDGA